MRNRRGCRHWAVVLVSWLTRAKAHERAEHDRVARLGSRVTHLGYAEGISTVDAKPAPGDSGAGE